MSLLEVFLIGLALGTDAFSMAVGVGLSGINRRKIYIISTIIAFFHVFMPLTGLLLGSWLGSVVGQLASFIGAAVLMLIGLQMFKEGLGDSYREREKAALPMQVYSGLCGMLVLAASVSLDALTVGFGLGTLKINLILTVLIMGTLAGFMTLSGFVLGKRMGSWLGEKAQLAGGIILVIIGIRMIFQ